MRYGTVDELACLQSPNRKAKYGMWPCSCLVTSDHNGRMSSCEQTLVPSHC